MKKIAVTAAIVLACTLPASAAMEIKDYPRTADELEYCAKARLNKDIEVPYGCRTLGERILLGISKSMKK